MSTVTTANYLNYINGEWVESTSNETIESINPAAPEEIVGHIQLSTKEDLDKAVEAAKNAQKTWRGLSGSERGEILYKVAAIMEERLEEIAECATREMGKTLAETKGETKRGIAILKYYAGEGMRKVGDVIPSTDNEALMFTTRVPLGVVGVITPWNFPVAIPIWKVAPALIYGNTVVIKPASESAVTFAKIAKCFADAGLPKGVLNMVTGSGTIVGGGIAAHPEIKGITFTGSNAVGKSIAHEAMKRGAKYQLEMGGKNPVIVAGDADIELAVDAVIKGAFLSTGQKCTATSRVIVEETIYDRFIKKLIAETKKITIGAGIHADSWMGPCASETQYKSVLQAIQTGINEGAKLILGGKPYEDKVNNGYFIEPTIFEVADQNIAIAREEIFGPVIALMKVSSMERAIDLANDSAYGLSASIFTGNITRMLKFVQEMEAGLIRVNAESAGVELQAPFGGMKESSSHSREQGEAAKEFFTSIKTVFVKG
ncbi:MULTISPECIES: alpha-ketoglutaric semialdehyde dehydrogenase GucD [Cytobacillus]|uniref:Aldehyde dehydrogenase family protein n=1 Tax=Cytobacillus stercorigallinarum TaxID=2762240 RepID=A0ABR8QS28_9BACI|nr:alpha-ketoglutaric semialdehyde dehydrogenase GucD [Cytobacillus stercorigallinarum]MBD7938359.1 aldehyde dehydrogenase family protein [Cytobacillus stercorigallinarum]